MKKLYKVARIASEKFKWMEGLELREEMTERIAERIAERCRMKKGGYVLNRNVLLEFLDSGVRGNDRFVLLALLVEVMNGHLIVVFI